MIKKIKNITNLAVFTDFNWNNSVKDKGGNVCEFKDINILYGRNYSGKTTISRILRALETGEISDKYENPEFSVLLGDQTEVTQAELNTHGKNIRVFNEDFVRDNLKFITNPDEGINSFAILGSENNVIDAEIESIKDELGSNEEGSETALYAELTNASQQLNAAQLSLNTAQGSLDSKLRKKALDQNIGIKYQSERFGDQNYNVTKLKTDIGKVTDSSYSPLADDVIKQMDALLNEKANATIPSIDKPVLKFSTFSEQTKQLIEKEIGVSGKIEELARNAVLHNWVKQGYSIHKGERDTCVFCDNKITESRWETLEKHFDEESEKLENDLNALVKAIYTEKEKVTDGFKINIESYYSKFHGQINTMAEKYAKESSSYLSSLEDLLNQLQNRINNLVTPFTFKQPDDFSSNIDSIWDELETVREESNNYTSSLKSEQDNAKQSLRLNEVYNYLKTIDYSNELESIQGLTDALSDIQTVHKEINEEVTAKEAEIESKKALLKDESKGAEKVNEYLNNFFGHNYLSLEAEEFQEEGSADKKFKFEVKRGGKKAFHLSEGECSLVAFCYFMGKLSEVGAQSSKPIIWIDDPISSLDGNHIFFVYSLIKAKIVKADIFEQLFVSTHSLDFLKYLKRLSIKGSNKNFCYFIVLRNNNKSEILLMPKYLKEYVTEFNYLFNHIYNCATIDIVDDSNHDVFYNFGNNARKFLEMYLYYKFPDNSDSGDKMEKFFGDEAIPAILTDRINNEMSHLVGGIERGSMPIEVPEMKSAAILILNKLKASDEEQYKSLLRSINVETEGI